MGSIQSCMYMYFHGLTCYLSTSGEITNIPPGSAHPKGMLKGHIFGNILHIFHLCSSYDDDMAQLVTFQTGLIACGYTVTSLSPIFQRADEHATAIHSREQEGVLHPPWQSPTLLPKCFSVWNFTQRIQSLKTFTTSDKPMPLNWRAFSPSKKYATSARRQSTWTTSLLPTANHLILGIGSL